MRARLTTLRLLAASLCLVLLHGVATAYAQSVRLGHGFSIRAAGSTTVAAQEVVSGYGSIKGSYFGQQSYTPYLSTSPFIKFAAGDTYRVTFLYRILAMPSAGFEVLFISQTAAAAGNFLPSTRIVGASGQSGTATLTSTLGAYQDYQVIWNVVGTGAIVIDDIVITRVATGDVIAAENAEDVEISAPSISNISPKSNLLAPGTTSVTISFDTSVATTCRYSLGTVLAYSAMQAFDTGAPATTHAATIAGLSSDPRVLNRVYLRCADKPDELQTLRYRSIAVPGGDFPRIGSIWWGEYLAQTRPEQAVRVGLYLAPAMSPGMAAGVRASNPRALFLPNVNATSTTTSVGADGANVLAPAAVPDSYYLKDITGKRIAIWPTEPCSCMLNLTKLEVAEFLAGYAYQVLEESNFVFDGIFFDNFFLAISPLKTDIFGKPVEIDADEDGRPDDALVVDAAWRKGVYHLLTVLRRLMPHAYISGHINQMPPTADTLAGFDGDSYVNAAVQVREGKLEFRQLLDAYGMWFATKPGGGIPLIQGSPPFQVAYGYGTSPFDFVHPSTVEFGRTFYPNMRFGLGAALMNDGFFVHDFGDTSSTVNWWYDEYDFDLGAALGPATLLNSGPPHANLIGNGGFDSATEPWQLINVTPAKATFAVAPASGPDGTAAAHVSVAQPGTVPWHVSFEQGSIALSAGVTYELRFRARADAPRRILVQTQGGPPGFLNYGLSVEISLERSWKAYALSFIAPFTVSDARVEFFVGAEAGEYRFDAVQLAQLPPQLYRREFAKGSVLLNGTSSLRTISLPTGFKRFSGTQAPRHQYIIDDSSDAFSSTGAWSAIAGQPVTTYFGGAIGAHSWAASMRQSTDSGASGQWNLRVPADGQYTIEVWLPSGPNASSWSRNAVYEVVSGGNVVLSRSLDQTSASAGDRWHAIGVASVSVSGAPFLRVRNAGSGTLVADAVHVRSAALYNDGAPATEVALEAFDAILLQRAQPLVATVPGAPTSVFALAGDSSIAVAFDAPASNGGSAIIGYAVSCGTTTATGTSPPITVSGLVNGSHYSCTVVATNAIGTGPASSPSNVAIPRVPLGLSVSDLDFGGQSLRTTSPSRVVAVSNEGTTVLTIKSITVPTDFTASHDCTALAAGASCSVNVAFRPVTEGPINGVLAIGVGNEARNIALAGIGEKSLVTHYYRSILQRAADAGGKAYWEDEAARMQALGVNINETWYALAMAFYLSPEYASFGRSPTDHVNDLYNTFFNRAADSAGLGYWTGLLASGLPREIVLTSFMFSAEFVSFTQGIFGNTAVRAEVDTVVDFYRGLLARLPDTGGFNYWVGQFRAAQCQGAGAVYAQVEAISSAYMNGAEYAARARSNSQFVGDMYNAFLRRGGDLAGVQYWIGQLDSGARSRDDVRRQFIASPEFSARVAAVVAQGCLQ